MVHSTPVITTALCSQDGWQPSSGALCPCCDPDMLIVHALALAAAPHHICDQLLAEGPRTPVAIDGRITIRVVHGDTHALYIMVKLRLAEPLRASRNVAFHLHSLRQLLVLHQTALVTGHRAR